MNQHLVIGSQFRINRYWLRLRSFTIFFNRFFQTFCIGSYELFLAVDNHLGSIDTTQSENPCIVLLALRVQGTTKTVFPSEAVPIINVKSQYINTGFVLSSDRRNSIIRRWATGTTF